VFSSVFQECDIGHNSILNAVKLKVVKKGESNDKMSLESEKQVPLFQDKPLCESLLDLQLTADEKKFLQQQSPGIFINYHN
jgi:hypothetical protein